MCHTSCISLVSKQQFQAAHKTPQSQGLTQDTIISLLSHVVFNTSDTAAIFSAMWFIVFEILHWLLAHKEFKRGFCHLDLCISLDNLFQTTFLEKYLDKHHLRTWSLCPRTLNSEWMNLHQSFMKLEIRVVKSLKCKNLGLLLRHSH